MKNVLIYNLKTLTAFLLCIFAVQIGCAQNIGAPSFDRGNSFVCQASDSEPFSITATFNAGTPNSTDVFTLELSNVDGSVAVGDTVVLDTASGADVVSGAIPFSVVFPEGTAGDNYRMIVRSSQYGDSQRTLSIPIYVSSNLDFIVNPRCAYVGQRLSANPEDANGDVVELDSYVWYRRDSAFGDYELVEGENSSFLIPTETGQYISLDRDYQGCFNFDGFKPFNFAEVREAPAEDVFVVEGSNFSLCADEEQILTSSETSADFRYVWYKDDVRLEDMASDNFTVTGSETPTLTVTGIDMGGEYRVGITTADTVDEDTCTDQSDIVTITLENPEIQITSDENVILFTEGQTTTLVSEVLNGDEPYTYTWYLDGDPLENSDFETIEVSEAGVYTVSLEAVSECEENFVFADESVTVGLSAGVESIVISANDDYISCVSELAILQVDSIVFELEDGGVIALNSDELEGIEFDWFRDGESTGVTESVYTVDSASENGAYTVVVDGVSSEEVSIVLALETFQITQTPDSLEEGGSVELSLGLDDTSNYAFQWLRNGVELAGENEQTLTVTEAGSYAVDVTSIECGATFPFEWTVSSGSPVVPNVVTPNNDGSNDDWVLPSEYNNREDIEVNIYTSSGQLDYSGTNYDGNWPDESQSNAIGTIYYYIISDSNGGMEKGSITIIR